MLFCPNLLTSCYALRRDSVTSSDQSNIVIMATVRRDMISPYIIISLLAGASSQLLVSDNLAYHASAAKLQLITGI